MKSRRILTALFSAFGALATQAQNPYLPMWEYTPDGEPYVFEDPDRPGEYRVYVYGSHDTLIKYYCGREQVVWSAPVDDLTNWRYDGVIFRSVMGPDNRPLNHDGSGDVLYAPDVTMRTTPDGRKEYFLYPNNQAWGREGMVARSERPDGPFRVCNWSADNPTRTEGVLRFDPAVFIDGTITVMLDNPDVQRGGIVLGEIALTADTPRWQTEWTIDVPRLKGVKGKHPLFFVFHSATPDKSLCELHDFQFVK